MKIITEKRSEDYIAYLEGNKGMWDRGTHRSNAIGNLIITWGKELGIDIEEAAQP